MSLIDDHHHSRRNNQFKPSAKGQFKKGVSGNPAGRPKGRPNYATLLKESFHAPVRVIKEGKTTHIPTYKAIIEVLQRDALKGDNRAMHALHEIMDMTGLTKQVTDEERERRRMKLPRPFSRDEFDLMLSEAREKERQRCRVALADENCGPIKARTAQEALATYIRAVAASKQKLEKHGNDKHVLAELNINAARIGLLADECLLAGDFEFAIRCANAAIAHAPLPSAPLPPANPNMAYPPIREPDPDLVWVRLIRTHARMLDGHIAEARDFYLRFQTKESEPCTSWETVILQDFERLRKSGHQSPLMTEIEQRFGQLGWSTTPGSPRRSVSHMLAVLSAPRDTAEQTPCITQNADRSPPRTVQPANEPDSNITLAHADDVESGNRLLERGKLNEALAVYYRHLDKWKLKYARNQINMTLIADSVTAAEKIGDIALIFILSGEHQAARDTSEKVLSDRPNTRVSLCLAHALMCLGHEEQARALYLKFRHERLDAERRAETVIRQDFAAMRAAGLGHRLMDEIENQLVTPEPYKLVR